MYDLAVDHLKSLKRIKYDLWATFQVLLVIFTRDHLK